MLSVSKHCWAGRVFTRTEKDYFFRWEEGREGFGRPALLCFRWFSVDNNNFKVV